MSEVEVRTALSCIMRIKTRWMVLAVCACLGVAWLVDYYLLTPGVTPGPAGMQALDCVDADKAFTFVFSRSGRRLVVDNGSSAHREILDLLQQSWTPDTWSRENMQGLRWKRTKYVILEQGGREKLRLYGTHLLVREGRSYYCYWNDGVGELRKLITDLAKLAK